MSGPTVEHGLPPWLVRVCQLVVALLALHLLYSALTLRIEYYDGYAYLSNARRLLGDDWAFYHPARPPLVPWLMAPAVALARLCGPANALLLIAPHLMAALLSLGSALVIHLVLRRALSVPLAWLGVALFMASRLFVRFGAHVMTDIPVTGLVALCFHLYLWARQRPSRTRYTTLGVAVACTVLTKYTLALVLPALLVAEVALAHHARRVDWPRLRLLLGTLALTLLGVAGVHAGLFLTLFPSAPLESFRSAFAGEVSVNVLQKGDPWLLQLWFAMVMQAPALLLFATLGVALRLRHLEPFDRVMLAWLVVVGGGVLLVPAQITARYTLPALPALIYFSLRPIADLRARLACRGAVERQARLLPALPALLLLAASYAATHQVWIDQDPVLRGDAQRLAVTEGLAATRGGSLRWIGAVHNLYPSRLLRVEARWSSSLFHYESFAASYLAGRPIPRPALSAGRALPLPSVLAEFGVDGDAYIVVDERRITLAEVESSPNPIEVWRLQRRELRRDAGDDIPRFVGGDGDWVLHHLAGEGLAVERGSGTHVVLGWHRGKGGHPFEIGSCRLQQGSICRVADASLGGVDTLVLLQVQRTLIGADGFVRAGPAVPSQ